MYLYYYTHILIPASFCACMEYRLMFVFIASSELDLSSFGYHCPYIPRIIPLRLHIQVLDTLHNPTISHVSCPEVHHVISLGRFLHSILFQFCSWVHCPTSSIHDLTFEQGFQHFQNCGIAKIFMHSKNLL